jgi:CBS domain-containing protein
MQVNRIATMGVETVRTDTLVRQAAEFMCLAEVGFLPVEDQGKVVGVITDRDIVVKCVAKGLNPGWITVGEIMSMNPAWIHEDAEICIAAKLMEDRGVRRLVVLDHDMNIIGILSLDDIASADPDAATMDHVISALAKHASATRVAELMAGGEL